MSERKRVLVADDETSIRLLVRSTLEDDSLYDIHEANDGSEALAYIRARTPDVVILDLMMPRVSGLDVLEDLRKNPPRSRPRIIVLTAKVNEEQHALDLGADSFLHKPFSPIQLVQTFEQALDLSSD